MRYSFIFLFIFILLFTMQTFAFDLNGSLSVLYEYSDEDEDDNGDENTFENRLILNDTELVEGYLKFNFYGKYTYEDDENSDSEEFTDIYSAYLDFRTFEDKLHIRMGRFSFINNTFMTIDGIEATFRTDKYFGVTLFGGIPKYLDKDDKYINEEFRDTGERIYGGKIFLNGVKDTNAYLSYSREEDDSTTIQELLGAGLGKYFRDVYFESLNVSLDGNVDYEINENGIYKADIRAGFDYKKVGLILRFTRFNVEDGYRDDRELIISNFSTGREDRYSYTVDFNVNDNINLYQGLIYTLVEYPSGEWIEGNIVKAGADFNYFKEIGVVTGFNGYFYDSELANAGGAGGYVDWNITNNLKWTTECEYVKLDNWKEDSTLYSFFTEFEYILANNYTISLYYENNEETRYLPENRAGAKFEYTF